MITLTSVAQPIKRQWDCHTAWNSLETQKLLTWGVGETVLWLRIVSRKDFFIILSNLNPGHKMGLGKCMYISKQSINMTWTDEDRGHHFDRGHPFGFTSDSFLLGRGLARAASPIWKKRGLFKMERSCSRCSFVHISVYLFKEVKCLSWTLLQDVLCHQSMTKSPLWHQQNTSLAIRLTKVTLCYVPNELEIHSLCTPLAMQTLNSPPDPYF